MITTDTICRALGDRIESIIQEHVPNAKKEGYGWKLGDINGGPGKSARIYRGSGGIFFCKDHATDNAVTILGLLHNVWGTTFVESCARAKEICNLVDVVRPIKKKKPKEPYVKRLSMRGTDVYEYWINRGIPEHIQVKYKLRRIERKDLPPSRELRWNESYTSFVWIDTCGDVVTYKWLGIEKNEDGKNEIGSTSQYATLWGWWLVDDNVREIILSEGEADTMSIALMYPDIPVLSLPSGAANLGFIENDFERLQLFEKVYISTDMDAPGEKAAQAIAKRLGLQRCFRISLPHGYKDANEFLLSKEHGKPDFKSLVQSAKAYGPKEMVAGVDILDKVLARGEEIRESLANRTFLFPRVDFKLCAKDTGILTGYVGHGKTDFANCVVLNEIRHGEIVCIVACDTPVDDLLRLCAWQMVGHEPSPIEIEACIKALDGKMFFVDGVEHPQTTESVLNNMKYAVARFGVTRFLIDNLSEIADIRKDDYQKQGEFVRAIDKFDKKEGTNSMIVAHALMSGDSCDWRIPGRRDVEGDKGMVKPIQYGLSIFRNKVKEKPHEFDEGDNTSKKIKRLLEGSDAYLSVWKQRNAFREEFELGLRYDKRSRWFAPEYEKFESPFPLYPTHQIETGDYGTRAPQNDAFTIDD